MVNSLSHETCVLKKSPQCQYYVLRKKRLCRMTVKPGREYCGEHEPQPETDDRKSDRRIPCPNDPKHSCYASKLAMHLSICNAREQEQPEYIIPNINASLNIEESPRLPLSKTPLKKIVEVIEKVNILYDKYLEDKIPLLPDKPIHTTVLDEFNEKGRTESSLRHLRQASRLLHIVESEQLVQPNTCYVELGAGKGHLSYYAYWAWCHTGGTDSSVLLIDRASLRHKRDNKLRDTRSGGDSGALDADCLPGKAERSNVHRIRADLAHLALARVPAVQARQALVGYTKHLCGVATDYALRCLTAEGALHRTAGAALATCCHHRCERAASVAAAPLQNLGINSEDFNVLLGIVSWATCGDGRSRQRRAGDQRGGAGDERGGAGDERGGAGEERDGAGDERGGAGDERDGAGDERDGAGFERGEHSLGTGSLNLSQEVRERVGKRAKLLLDWGRVLYLEECGFDARLVYYVPPSVSLENVCIIAKKKQIF